MIRVITLTDPITITKQVAEQIQFPVNAITLNSILDDGVSIIASVTFANGIGGNLKLYTSYDYQPLRNISDADINARVKTLSATVKF